MRPMRSKSDPRAAVLSRLRPLRHLSAGDLNLLAATFDEIRLPAGAVLTREGRVAEDCYSLSRARPRSASAARWSPMSVRANSWARWPSSPAPPARPPCGPPRPCTCSPFTRACSAPSWTTPQWPRDADGHDRAASTDRGRARAVRGHGALAGASSANGRGGQVRSRGDLLARARRAGPVDARPWQVK
jgi:hypothetical protein